MKPQYLSREHPLNDARHDRFHPWSKVALLAMVGTCLAGYLWQGFVHHIWGASLIGLVVSAGHAGGFHSALKAGHIPTLRGGEFSRHTHLFSFWLVAVLTLTIYLGTTTAMFVLGRFSWK